MHQTELPTCPNCGESIWQHRPVVCPHCKHELIEAKPIPLGCAVLGVTLILLLVASLAGSVIAGVPMLFIWWVPLALVVIGVVWFLLDLWVLIRREARRSAEAAKEAGRSSDPD